MGEPGRCPHGHEESRAPHGLPWCACDTFKEVRERYDLQIASLQTSLAIVRSTYTREVDRAELAEREAATLREALAEFSAAFDAFAAALAGAGGDTDG